MFKFQRPIYWYFTSAEKTLMRKSDAKLTSENIYKTFLRGTDSRCEIVACYFYTKEMCFETLKTMNGVADLKPEEIPTELKVAARGSILMKNVVCEFLDRAGLSIFAL